MFMRCATLSLALLACSSNITLIAGPIMDIDQKPYGVVRPVAASFIGADGSMNPLSSVGHDGSGLNRPSPIRGVHGNDAADMVSVPFDGESPVTIQYDLGDLYNINELWLWQYNELGETDRGIKDFDIVFRDEFGEVVGELSGATTDRGNGLTIPASYYCPLAECVRFIELVIRDNYGDDMFAGLSDIAFAGRLKTLAVPEPSNLTIVSLLGLYLISRNRRRSS